MEVVKPRFKLGCKVKIECSGESGVVVGVAEYDFMDPQCLLRYRSADGAAVEMWWDEGALIHDKQDLVQ